jgi:sugar-specific transcriptional regulator TrmB
MQNGWIKMYRKIQEKCFYKKSQYVHLWIHLLLNANRKPKEFMWNGNIILIKEGQMITGRKTLSSETGIPESTIEDILKFLEKQHQIQQQKNNKFRLISIVNWIKHQQLPTAKATSRQHLADTNKNIKKYKKEDIAEASSATWDLEEKLKEMESVPNSYLDIIATFIREKPVKIENSRQLSNVISRFCRVAKKMEGAYTNKQIFAAAERVKADNLLRRKKGQEEIDYTPDTFYKYLTK